MEIKVASLFLLKFIDTYNDEVKTILVSYDMDSCLKHIASSKSIIFTSPELVNAIFDGFMDKNITYLKKLIKNINIP